MKHAEGTFKSLRGLKIFYQGWLPDGDVKAVLFIVHGLGEHSGRYMNVVDHFVPLGYAVYGLDHIGHGKSDGGREQVDRFEDFARPLTAYYNMIKGWQPGKPIFLYGHSLGGLIACNYLVDHQADFKGAIISAALVRVPANISPVTVAMGKVLSSIAPKAGVVPLNAAGISRDPAVVDAYENDPMVFHGKTPARLAAEMLKTMQCLAEEAGRITLPLFILQGSADKLVDPGDAQLLYDKASSKDKTLKMYAGFYHEVHNEPEREMMFKDLEAWLHAHI
jgi:acylglycerol lipase